MILGPRSGPVSNDDLLGLYDWPERDGRPWVRAMMSCTLDGAAAGSDGLSGSLSSDADGAVFSTTRRFADAILVGGGTLTAEEYGPTRSTEADAEQRAAAGQRRAPVIAVVSGSLRLPLGEESFVHSPEQPLVFTHAHPDPERLAAVREHCEVVQSDSDHVSASWVVDELARRGLWRIVCEGGPSLLRDVAEDGLVDEADLTFAPLLVGSENTPTTTMLTDARTFTLRHVLTADSYLMTRYVRETA